MNGYTVSEFNDRFLPRIASRDDHHFMDLGKMKRQIRKDLTGGRGVGIEKAIEEDNLHALRLIIQSPIIKRSILVRRKQSSASSGLQTTGSFSLKEVFKIKGTSVIASNVLIRS